MTLRRSVLTGSVLISSLSLPTHLPPFSHVLPFSPGGDEHGTREDTTVSVQIEEVKRVIRALPFVTKV
jgi:hypothetical protein